MDVLGQMVCFIKGHKTKIINPEILPRNLTQVSLKSNPIGLFYNKRSEFPSGAHIRYCKRCWKWEVIRDGIKPTLA